jgi:signal transduction histidine kinase
VSPLPDDEAARLQELRSYNLIDTPSEVEFDDLVRLASIICEVPIALVSLVDESRQGFKAKQGLDVHEIPRSVAFCSHTILQKNLLVVEDAIQDERFSSNPLVLGEPHIRFYAGAPLITAAGHALGSLCVIDFVPRTLDAPQREALRLLSRQVVSQIERRWAKADMVVAEKINKAMDQLLSLLSHELRTPLNAIVGWAQILSKSMVSDSQVRQASGAIARSARAQGRIIDDLLTLHRMVAGDVSITQEPLLIVDVVGSVVDSFEEVARDKKITITRDGFDCVDALVFGDRARLHQLVGSLISNAIRFSPAESIVEVSLKNQGDAVQLSVSDHGIGIAQDFLPHVFDRFRQADLSRSCRYGGMGIGLTIAKYLVELHQGSISAYSAGEGKGACFKVTLPLVKERATAGVSPVVTHSGEVLCGKRILVVDDETYSLELVLQLLREQGAEVFGARSAAEGLKLAAQLQPELIVSDISMPITDGYGFIRELRARTDLSIARVPALALTALSGDKERANALVAGFTRYMSKPFDGKELIGTLGEMLQAR